MQHMASSWLKIYIAVLFFVYIANGAVMSQNKMSSILNGTLDPSAEKNNQTGFGQQADFNSRCSPNKGKREYWERQIPQINTSFDQYVKDYNPKNLNFKLSKAGNFLTQGFQISIQESEAYQRQIFQQNLRIINQHNSNLNRTFNMGVNQYMLFSQIMFDQIFSVRVVPQMPQISSLYKTSSIYRMRKTNILRSPYLTGNSLLIKNNRYQEVIQLNRPPRLLQDQFSKLRASDLAENEQKNAEKQIQIDWSCKFPDLEIYYQGYCGSCYAFAALDSIFISLKIMQESRSFFSVQQILSCAINNKTLLGCSGGYFSDVFNYVKQIGIGPEYLYKYNSVCIQKGLTPTCDNLIINSKKYNSKRFYISNFKVIEENDCKQLISQLKQKAVAVAISTNGGFQFYRDGTFSSTFQKINHGVTLMGYNTQRGYLIKNSWGNTWGMRGYAYVNESTGVCRFAVAPIL